jgi:3-oxoacyl-[acyl-carrier-protein] synthase III
MSRGEDLKKYAQIAGWGMCVPSRILHNRDFEKMVDTTDEWIRSRTGIVQRHVVGPKETTGTLAIRAAQNALEVADFSPAKVDFIVVATMTPDRLMPSVATAVQDALGAARAGAVDVNAACSGFVYALSLANALITSGTYRNILVIGAETLSRYLDFTDRRTCILFGDGAGAVLLQASDTPGGLLSSVLGSDGSGGDLLHIPGGGSRMPPTIESVNARQHYVQMNGNEVFRFAVTTVVRSTQEALKNAHMKIDDIDLFIPHQANIRIIQSAAKSLGIPPEKVYTNVDRFGNTSSASIPIALCEAIEQGRVKPGHNIALVGFGGGLTWGSAIFQWGAPVPTTEAPWWRHVVHNLREREASIRSLALKTSRRLDSLRLNGRDP